MSVYASLIEKLLKRNARLAEERDALADKVRALELAAYGEFKTPKKSA